QNGKYLYRINNHRFEIDRFNRQFDQYKKIREEEMERQMKKTLDDLNKPQKITPVYNLPLGQILINTKDAQFDILDDMLQLNFNKDILIKNNRLFYVGICILLIALITFFILVM